MYPCIFDGHLGFSVFALLWIVLLKHSCASFVWKPVSNYLTYIHRSVIAGSCSNSILHLWVLFYNFALSSFFKKFFGNSTTLFSLMYCENPKFTSSLLCRNIQSFFFNSIISFQMINELILTNPDCPSNAWLKIRSFCSLKKETCMYFSNIVINHK